jgi:hypothetical protein
LSIKQGPYNNEAFTSLKTLKEAFLAAWNSQNYDKILKEVRNMRSLISTEVNPPLTEFLDLGIEDYLLEVLKNQYSGFFELQYEVSWILSNICSVNSARLLPIINKGLIPHLVNLLTNLEFFENVSDICTIFTRFYWV